MNGGKLIQLAFVIAAVPVAVLSIFFGFRHIGYVLIATLSATLVWATVSFLDDAKRRKGVVLGVLVSVVIQQLTYHFWKAEMSGLWWPLAQFIAIHILIAFGLGKTPP